MIKRLIAWWRKRDPVHDSLIAAAERLAKEFDRPFGDEKRRELIERYELYAGTHYSRVLHALADTLDLCPRSRRRRPAEIDEQYKLLYGDPDAPKPQGVIYARRGRPAFANAEAFTKWQAAELWKLLEQAGDDPVLAPQLRERLADAERKLSERRSSQ